MMQTPEDEGCAYCYFMLIHLLRLPDILKDRIQGYSQLTTNFCEVSPESWSIVMT